MRKVDWIDQMRDEPETREESEDRERERKRKKERKSTTGVKMTGCDGLGPVCRSVSGRGRTGVQGRTRVSVVYPGEDAR